MSNTTTETPGVAMNFRRYADSSQAELFERALEYMPRAEEIGKRARTAFRDIRGSSTGKRNRALLNLADSLALPANLEKIMAANAADLEKADEYAISSALKDRLKLNEKRINSMITALREIAALPDPVGEIESGGRLASGVEMIKKRVPLGVVFTIYESRPNVTVDIGALCVKSGNAAVLRGGKEAIHSNLALHALFQDALRAAGLPEDAVIMVDETDRAFMTALLQQDQYLDLVVPRGGEALIKFISGNSSVPVVKHDKGVCNLYIDESADPAKALEIAANAKLQRPSVCNAVENLLVHANYAGARDLLQGLKERGAELRGCERTRAILPDVEAITEPDEEYGMEYLDNRLAVKVVDSLDEVSDFIFRYGSSHSEAIVAESHEAIERFSRALDSAAIFVNCSTRFHDGGQMGMGAEVGISTGRLHVRGPMGLRDLTTMTYLVTGRGEIRE